LVIVVKALLAIALAAALLLSGCASQPGLPPVPGGDQPPTPPSGGDEPIACAADAKVCPDGTAVGRTGPDCEFAPCPGGEGQMTEELCKSSGGHWNICAHPSYCSGDTCTADCVAECECGGIAGFGCPAGYRCTDYLPKYAADAMGVCWKA
jgi:hypothetical protein